MSNKILRMLLCAATMAVLGAFGTAARATVYDLGWDPLFAGDVLVDLDPACTDLSTSCLVRALGGTFTDSLGDVWGIIAQPTGFVDPVQIIDGQLVRLTASFGIFSESEVDCDGSSLSFFLDGTVSLHCGGGPSDTATSYTATVVPEPATLALLGLGLIVAGFTGSRRKAN